MSGLFLILVLVVWAGVAAVLTKLTVKHIASRSLKDVIAVILFLVLLIAPVADELIGAQQFKSLCDAHAMREADFASLAGHTVKIANSNFEPVKGTMLETTVMVQDFLDPVSGRQLFANRGYRSKGGWLIRTLRISESNAPLMFDESCRPVGGKSLQDWLDKYQIKTVIDVR